MTGYFKYFKIPFIVVGIFTVISLVVYLSVKAGIDTERHNSSWDSSQSVFDYADKMTSEEEEELNQQIQLIQERCQTDIAFVIINDPENGYLDSVHRLAEEFAEDNHMGYDYPGGSSVVFVDNWSRGGDGKIHSWLATTGMIRERISDDECDEMLYILDDIPSDDSDPYVQYSSLAKTIGKKGGSLSAPFSVGMAALAALVISVIYIIINWRSKLGDVTVNAGTYVDGGNGHFSVATDTFSHKTVTKHKIERSSGGGGGGGGSHGGGGHSR